MNKTVAIVQARMGSTRLPGKVLLDVAGEPMLAWCFNRVRRARTIDVAVVATTLRPADDPIEALCGRRGWPCFRGSEEDVLDRFYRAALAHQAGIVVRVTSDCPLIEPAIIDGVVDAFRQGRPAPDYAANVLPPRTFPRGLDTEVIGFRALERAWREDANPAWREHVTPYIYRHPELFRLQRVANPRDLSSMRWTVDTPEDLAFVRTVCRHFGDDQVGWQEILAALDEHPEWAEINRGTPQKIVS